MPKEAERGTIMSNIKTRMCELYYEGRYWRSRQQYLDWVKDQRTVAKDLNKAVAGTGKSRLSAA